MYNIRFNGLEKSFLPILATDKKLVKAKTSFLRVPGKRLHIHLFDYIYNI